MKKAEPELAAEVERWLREDQAYWASCRDDELPEWVANKQERLEKNPRGRHQRAGTCRCMSSRSSSIT
jgi:hypothetical protein